MFVAAVYEDHNAEQNDECPRPAKPRNFVGDAVSEAHLLFNHIVRVPAGANAHQLLRRVKLPAHDGQHIHTRHRFLLQQSGDIVTAHLETSRLFNRKRCGLVGRIFKH